MKKSLFAVLLFLHSLQISAQCLANFTNTPECMSSAIIFTNTSTGNIVSYSWNFGDPVSGANNTSNLENPVHIFQGAGTVYNITLIIDDGNGCNNSITKTVNLKPKPVASWAYLGNTCKGSSNDTLYFSNSSTVSASTPVSTPLTYQWDFGDPASGINNTSTSISPKHLFSAIGLYQVKLVVTTSLGCKDSLITSITINSAPVPGFTAPPACVNSPVLFTNTSTVANGAPMTYTWSFTSGTPPNSTAVNPTVTWTVPSPARFVILRATANGCTSIPYADAIPVFAKPVPNFTVPAAACANNGIAAPFTNTTTGPGNAYLWNFDDPASGVNNTSNSTSPSHIFSNAKTTFNVKLVVTNTGGCKDSITIPYSTLPQPVAAFTIGSMKCVGDVVQFTNASTPAVLTKSWNFGDPSTLLDVSTSSNPSYLYKVGTGPFNVQMIVTDINGCKDTANQSLTLNAQPVAAFVTGPTCQGSPVNFTDNTLSPSSPVTSWAWDFGNATTSNQQNPTSTFAGTGPYNVELIVVNSNLCRDTVVKLVNLGAQPVPNFNVGNLCTGGPVAFADASITFPTVTSWNWNFGDAISGVANNSNLQNPTHTFVGAGPFNVQLAATSNQGCSGTISKSITLSQKPNVEFAFAGLNGPTATCKGTSNDTIYFTNNSTIIPTVALTYTWDFGDPASGVFNTSTNTAPKHVFTAVGTYNVKLVVTSPDGCIDSLTKQIIIHVAPVASFTSTPGCVNSPVLFTNTSTVSDGSTMTYAWTFLSGTPANSTTVNPTVTWTTSSPGRIVTLRATSSHGCVSPTIAIGKTINPKSTSSFSYSASCVNTNVVFTNTSTGATSYTWDFGDPASGINNSSLVANPVHTFSGAGPFIVKLITTNAGGCNDSINSMVSFNSGITTDFNFSGKCINQPIQFTDLSVTSTGSITAWSWDFGDGTTSITQNPTHQFSSDGSFQVSLTVTSNNGCTKTLSKTINISPQPVADFSPSAWCNDDPVIFYNNASTTNGNIISWHWKFGDGNTSISQNPFNIYSTDGPYDVELIVTNSSGCKDTVTKTITKNGDVVADFSTTQNCYGTPVQFTDASTTSVGTISNWKWYFDNSVISDLQNHSYTFTQENSAVVKLVVISNTGCTDSITKSISLLPDYPLDFTIQNYCAGYTASLNAVTSLPIGVTPVWEWKINNNVISDLPNTSYIFDGADDYIIKLKMITDENCADSVSKTISVSPILTAVLFFHNKEADGLTYSFQYFNNISSGDFISYSWNFGDSNSPLNTSNEANPVHLFSGDGTYLVQVDAITSQGCTAHFQHTFQVTGLINKNLSITKSEIFIFPNPFNNELNISIPENCNAEEIKILRNDGVSVYTGKNLDHYNKIDLQFLSPGIYLVQLKINGHYYSETIIKY